MNPQTNPNQLLEDEIKLNQELGLIIPSDVLTESIPNWNTFFSMMRRAYKLEMLTSEEITQHYNTYHEIPDHLKEQTNVDLDYILYKKEQELYVFDSIQNSQRIEDEVNDVLSQMDPDKQQILLNLIASGQTGSAKAILGVGFDDFDTDDSIVLDRISKALEGRHKFKASDLTSTNQGGEIGGLGYGKVLNASEIEERFDDTLETNNQNYNIPPAPQPVIDKLVRPVPTPQPAITRPQVRSAPITPPSSNSSQTPRFAIPNQVRNIPNQPPRPIIPNQNPTQQNNPNAVPQRKIAGLDDLLNKKTEN